ncbi:NADH-ubiquinone oxidoreductase chain 1 [Capsicum baccatum]|uniref:NADH-ubiquinone oxidoreductase chain 1 n=1 Tax=Capsicum baccatum TaxID=33114 RepID=A0A2G2WCB6_CAPBA|nr:NADH-ubiquinone oxidoreductase chain 1 [Capsicum baccatum]
MYGFFEKGVIPPPIRPDDQSTELHPYSPGLCTSLSPGGWLPILDFPFSKKISGLIWFSSKECWELAQGPKCTDARKEGKQSIVDARKSSLSQVQWSLVKLTMNNIQSRFCNKNSEDIAPDSQPHSTPSIAPIGSVESKLPLDSKESFLCPAKPRKKGKVPWEKIKLVSRSRQKA